MKIYKRAELIKAMELLARAVNDETVFETWLLEGVADGDITGNVEDDEIEYYAEDKTFADLMDTFLNVMADAKKSGGLYFDGIVSKSMYD